MALRLLGHIELPPNRGKGGFDHADVHLPSDRLYVAHTSNDALDVIDIAADLYIESIGGLTGVAGALVSEARGTRVYIQSRRKHCLCICPGCRAQRIQGPGGCETQWFGIRPRPRHPDRRQCWRSSILNSHSVSVVDIARRERIAEIGVPGRTRWTIIRCGTRDVLR